MGRLTLNALLSFAQCKKDRARFGHAARPCQRFVAGIGVRR
jgi:hypothetical protein